ncbi:hypothetical protein LT493_01680 [Streptomyces tricolor]|nr:hypothetical protein [Streptomyces tricolor]
MFSGAERAKAFGVLGTVIGVSTAAALAGGLLIDAVGTGRRLALGVLRQPADSGGRLRGGSSGCCPRLPAMGRHEEFDLFGVLLPSAPGVFVLMLPPGAGAAVARTGEVGAGAGGPGAARGVLGVGEAAGAAGARPWRTLGLFSLQASFTLGR